MWKYVGAAMVGVAIMASAARGFAKSETVTGKVIDLYCYSRDKEATGMDHRDGRECALACIKWEGQPVGVLTTDGKVYQLAGGVVAKNNAKIAPHLTHTVTVTGEVTEKDGMTFLTTDDVTMVKK